MEDSSGRIVLKWTSANVSLEHATSHFLANLLLDNLSNDRNYQFPDNSGTIALTSDIPTPVNFADNETPTGTFDGVNITFTLAHTPNPLASLQLFLNGQFQTQGVDYVLVTSSIIYSSPPPDAFSGLPFKAFYRY